MITQTLPTRELISLRGLGVTLRGTLHTPSDTAINKQAEQNQTPLRSEESARFAGRLAVVFVNSLTTPRAGCSDTAVYWADAFATLGYPTFRLDLPGLGDSAGELPPELVNYISNGGHGAILAAKISELTRTYNLRGVVLGGLCAGSVSTLFAASERKECKGLILLDPYFHLPMWAAPKLSPGFVHWSRRTRLGHLLRYTYDRVREKPWAIGREALPRNANFPLLARWKQVATVGTPILIVKSPGIEPRPGQFDYLEYVQGAAGRDSRVLIRTVSDTDHSFSNHAGREAVRLHAENFLTEYFPLAPVAAAAPVNDVSVPTIGNHCEINSGYLPA